MSTNGTSPPSSRWAPVLVKPLEQEDRTTSGIFLPETAGREAADRPRRRRGR